jgi:hypothetical protein
MNVEADLAYIGQQLWLTMSSFVQMWLGLIKFGLNVQVKSFLCGEFSIADAFYAPVVMRLNVINYPSLLLAKVICKRYWLWHPFSSGLRQRSKNRCLCLLMSRIGSIDYNIYSLNMHGYLQ